MQMVPGPRNLITDVPGFAVGNAQNAPMKTGATVLTGPEPFGASCHVMGGAPGTRETDLLTPEALIDRVDAIVLSGGSAMGLEAASGVAEALQAQGRGVPVYGKTVPIVPAAIVLDYPARGEDGPAPWRLLGVEALAAQGADFALGSAGAGIGATTADLKGGLGSASAVLPSGVTVGAMVVANPIGTVIHGSTGQFFAAPFELGTEFGGLGSASGPASWAPTKVEQGMGAGSATSIAIVATDAILSKAELKRLSVMAHDGLARAILPSHTPFDGDIVFAASSRQRPIVTEGPDMIHLGHAAASCLARAVARAIYAATPAPGDPKPTWSQAYGADRGG
ncbi:MAG: P1 family peptidase [Pseudomonadota bacterium]